MTAVEWFAQKLYKRMNMSGDGQVFDKILDEAKELEKQQIIDAYENGQYYGDATDDTNGNDYYNQTY